MKGADDPVGLLAVLRLWFRVDVLISVGFDIVVGECLPVPPLLVVAGSVVLRK